MFGRLPDGTAIPGGPYTSVQFAGAVGSIVLLWNTIEVWGRFGLTNVAILLGVPTGLTYALRGVKLHKRNPLTAMSSAAMAYVQPRGGRTAGRPVRLPRPHRARGRLVVQELPAGRARSSAPSPAPRSSPGREPGPAGGAPRRGSTGSASTGSASTGSARTGPGGDGVRAGQRAGQRPGQRGGAVELLSGVDRLLAEAARARAGTGAPGPVPADAEERVA